MADRPEKKDSEDGTISVWATGSKDGSMQAWSTGSKDSGMQKERRTGSKDGTVACRPGKQEVSMMAARKNRIASRDNNDRRN